MLQKMLIVDDDQDMLSSLQEGFGKFRDAFAIMVAEDGVVAIEKLKKDTISLVVTDLKMPRMDGFTLLSYIMEHYPFIPVIVMTAYSTPKMKQMAERGGAVGYIEKPFMIEDLAQQVMATLKNQAEGGTLHGVSSGMFLQLIEMEERTCTIWLSDKFSGKQGILFFRQGELIDARSAGLVGEPAAHEIFSWEKVNLSIQNVCSQKKRTIYSDLQAIFLHAMQIKDEIVQAQEPVVDIKIPVETEEIPEEKDQPDPDPIDRIWNILKKEIGENSGLENIFQDNAWDELIGQFDGIGKLLNSGSLMVGHIDKGESHTFILIPGKETTVVTVSPNCPRDKILKILSL